MEIVKMQQTLAEPAGEEGSSSLFADLVQPFIAKFEFEGDAAELVGQAGTQPDLGIKCTCCGEAERRKTLICDACGNSFHLKCLKLRLSHALLFDHWLCRDCSSPQHTLAFGDDGLSKRSSPSKRRRHSHAPQALPHLEDGASKIRFVFKLKTSHFKGARALANEEERMANDRSTDESIKEVLDNAKKPSGVVQQQGQTLSCQETSEELHKKKAKLPDVLLVPEKDKKDAGISKLPSCQMQSLSFDHQQNRASLDQCKNFSEEFLGDFGLLEEKANTAVNSTSQKHIENVLESVTHHSGLEFDDECHKHNGNVCRSGASSEMVKEMKFVEVQENEREIDDRTDGKIDMAEEATLHNTDRPKTSFVGVDAYPKQSGYAVGYRMTSSVGPDACSSRSGYVDTNEKVDEEAEENRSLVRVLDDAQKQLWHKDAIDFMDLEPSRGSNDRNTDDGEAVLLSKPHPQLHVKLDTTRILQVYADCRERCIIVYRMCGVMETSEQTSVNVSDLAIERTWSLGGGFYVLLLGSKRVAKEVIFNGTIPFQGGNGYAVPYVPCFSPNQGPERACPVWVTFLHLPIYFRPFLQELAARLGKVLHIPYGEALEPSDSPRVCICWKISKCIPEFLLVDMEGLGSKKLKIEFDVSLLRHLSESLPQKVASTVALSLDCQFEEGGGAQKQLA